MICIESDIHFSYSVNTEKSFWNIIKLARNQIVFTILRLIWIQTDFRLDPNQSENGKYNLISGWFNKISRKKIFVCKVLPLVIKSVWILVSWHILRAIWQAQAELQPLRKVSIYDDWEV